LPSLPQWSTAFCSPSTAIAAIKFEPCHAFITSKLDNSNSLLHGLPKFLFDRLQNVQNSAARIITGSRKYDHITPVLKQLHWLLATLKPS
jgi:hypothetical protein